MNGLVANADDDDDSYDDDDVDDDDDDVVDEYNKRRNKVIKTIGHKIARRWPPLQTSESRCLECWC